MNYKTAKEIVAAFHAGAKFIAPGRTHASEEIEDIYLSSAGHVAVRHASPPNFVTLFTPEGNSVLGHGARLLEVSPPAPEPFLKRVLKGEKFHCPETRENLIRVVFETGELTFVLQDADGTILDRRDSKNYNHEGKHKWVPGRSLVPGVCPPKPKVKTYTAEELFTTAPVGFYQPSYGSFKARVLINGLQRAALFIDGGVTDLLGRGCWDHLTFTRQGA